MVWPKGEQLAACGFADLYDHRFANLGFAGVEFSGQPIRLIETTLLWRTGAPGPGEGGIIDTATRATYKEIRALHGRSAGAPWAVLLLEQDRRGVAVEGS